MCQILDLQQTLEMPYINVEIKLVYIARVHSRIQKVESNKNLLKFRLI